MIALQLHERGLAHRARARGRLFEETLVRMEGPAPDLRSAGYALDQEIPAAQELAMPIRVVVRSINAARRRATLVESAAPR